MIFIKERMSVRLKKQSYGLSEFYKRVRMKI